MRLYDNCFKRHYIIPIRRGGGVFLLFSNVSNCFCNYCSTPVVFFFFGREVAGLLREGDIRGMGFALEKGSRLSFFAEYRRDIVF